MTTWVTVSFSEEQSARLLADGPRRDLLELAAATNATVVYRDGAPGKGWRARLTGPHLRQAWHLAGRLGRGDRVLADGEHTGVPLLLFAALRRRHPARVVVIGHLVSKPWKLAALAVATRLGSRGTLVLHSVEQERRVRRWLGRRWRTALVPYQVDTTYWTSSDSAGETPHRPRVLAVGAENRDYATLLAAVDGLDVDVIVAAGSHWARDEASGGQDVPANIRFIRDALPFAELRELYRSSQLVAVPLQDVPNQSGITVLLEAMSCERPVIVTATRGQRECVAGPLVTAGSGIEHDALRDRGPAAVLGPGATATGVTGLYTLPGDADGLRRAIALLAAHPSLRDEIGRNGRASAVANFGLPAFVERLAGELGRGRRG